MPLDSSPDAPGDFDFIIGDWAVQHERLTELFVGSTDWVTFDGLSSTSHVLGGLGNVEDNLLRAPTGDFRAVALRSFDPSSRQWSIWWLDGRNPTSLDTPVAGAFDGGVGTFLAHDTLDGVAIVVRFIWNATLPHPTWQQAFSRDDGSTWETNWRMTFTAR